MGDSENGSNLHNSSFVSIAVAIDKDKNSPHAVRWAIDNQQAMNNPHITLIHVMRRTQNDQGEDGHEIDERDIFGLYRGYSARKGVQLKEVVIEENDISKALLDYIVSNQVTSMVVGASTRSALSRKLKNPDVPNILSKAAPDFCSIYVISKGKVVSVKPAQRPAAALNTALTPNNPASVDPLMGEFDQNDAHRYLSRGTFHMRRRSLGLDPMAPEKKIINDLKPPRASTSNMDSSDLLQSPIPFGSMDLNKERSDFSVIVENDCPGQPLTSQRELEAEMRRLKLELKQTMDMYSNACKEALSAKKKAEELQQLKMEEARRFEEAKHAEEVALAMAEMEKAKCMAALEVAEKAQKLAEEEAQRRRQAELKAKQEIQEKDMMLSTFHQNDIRYQKYTLDEIEEATNMFSRDNKIGEGGYGPVYKGTLNHTRVAIKVLRPDAKQGQKQFHQEVEILCRMRHPSLVLLLGACPEYGCLVYEYMDFGSLEDRLFRRGHTPIISWRRRFKIAAEIATALLFLHQAKPEPLVHRDLKPANILLDHNYRSKISDVGLARLVPPSVADSVTQYHMTCAAGTFCYIDPEYQQTGRLSRRSDTYSLGVMFLQMITARPPMGLSHQVQVAIEKGKLAEILDPAVRDWPMEEALAFAKLALQCTELRKKDRPDLGTVIVPELNKLRDFARFHDPNKVNRQNTMKSSPGSAGGVRTRRGGDQLMISPDSSSSGSAATWSKRGVDLQKSPDGSSSSVSSIMPRRGVDQVEKREASASP
ncbi:hypothetical protein SAY87_030559 [Trapa incisa]|uniref:RING-type E3 ubiquitin transferase n=1 Tax=Trapa incisa TaxID=236973 RepID=A0AAN7QJT8_9MYRT|nr:hypothetical protein SAY87_030559 [Trapa incisa]